MNFVLFIFLFNFDWPVYIIYFRTTYFCNSILYLRLKLKSDPFLFVLKDNLFTGKLMIVLNRCLMNFDDKICIGKFWYTANLIYVSHQFQLQLYST